MAQNYRLTLKSSNAKTGPIPVSTTSSNSCPFCPLHENGSCYAAQGPLKIVWLQVDAGKYSTGIDAFCEKVAALPEGTLWRHNQAGDLPGDGDTVDAGDTGKIVEANRCKRGFTYTHKPVLPGSAGYRENAAIVAAANAAGFTINLSGNNLEHADELAGLAIGPVVTLLPSGVQGNCKVSTPAGRKVVVCPATYRDDVNCAKCGLCAVRDRKVIVGFPAHGAKAKAADSVARA